MLRILFMTYVLILPFHFFVMPCNAGGKTEKKAWVAVFDFKTVGNPETNAQVLKDKKYGHQLADSVRLKLRKQGDNWKVIDRLTTADMPEQPGIDADLAKVRKLMTEKLGVNVIVCGSVSEDKGTIRAEIRCIDIRDGLPGTAWTRVFSDRTERARAVIAGGITEAIVSGKLWKPPEYGDEAQPPLEKLGRPLNTNGGFDNGRAGWDRPDNVSTFIEKGPADRGSILRVKTDLNRDKWLAYRKALRKGQADPANPPDIPEDKSYSSVGGLEGVHFRSAFIKTAPGMRYWLLADHKGYGGKIFVKGFRRTSHALDGLPESSMAELGITPARFAEMPMAKRKLLIEADSKKHPEKYFRECYRWYLNCKGKTDRWTHHAAAFPPRGGLPEYVEYLSIQVYSYWPAAEYLWDNVHLYKDPNMKAPLPEALPRTKNFGNTSDAVEKQSRVKE